MGNRERLLLHEKAPYMIAKQLRNNSERVHAVDLGLGFLVKQAMAQHFREPNG
jgi:hypothetical protein